MGGKETQCFVRAVTKNFAMRFQERFSREITIHELNQLLSESKCIRRTEIVFRFIDGTYKRRKVLGEFFHRGAGIIMLIDEWKGRAVTVVT